MNTTQNTHPITHAHEVRNEVRKPPGTERSVGLYVRSVVPTAPRQRHQKVRVTWVGWPARRVLPASIAVSLAA